MRVTVMRIIKKFTSLCLGVVAVSGLFGLTTACAQTQKPAHYRAVWSLDTCLKMVSLDPYGAQDYVYLWQARAEPWQTHYCYGFALRQQDDDESAAQEFLDVAQMQQTHQNQLTKAIKVSSLKEASEIWYLLGDIPRAKSAVQLGLSLDEKDPSLQAISVRIWLDEGKVTLAYEKLLDCRKHHVTSPELTLLLAEAESDLGKNRNALKDIDFVLSSYPQNTQALLLRGEIWDEIGAYPKAKRDWQKIIQIAPGTHEADMASQDLILMSSDPDIP